jgi:UDP-N-acetylglucosamine 2-epimerase (non-hydrolysing)
MHTLSVVGTRPNFVKMAPVLAALRARDPDGRHVLVHTGQHYDRIMSDVFLDELGVLEPDYRLDTGSGTHAVQTARVMEALEPVVEKERPDLVLVPGDVNSTLAAALVAAKLCIPIAHVEAGLRSFDPTMPEEINRIVVDRISQFLFVHSSEAVDNLRAEGVPDERIHFVGNTMIDSLVAVGPRVEDLDVPSRIGVTPNDYVLVTLHRPSLVDGPLLATVVEQLNEISNEIPVVFPAHPRTYARIEALGMRTRFHWLEPLGYLDFLALESAAAAVLTDSGGVQEETTFFGVPCFTLRHNTERPVTVHAGTNTVLGLAPERIPEILPALAARNGTPPPPPPHGWDGHAAQRLVAALGDHALDERHLENLLVHDRPVAEEALLAEELAVVRGDDHPGVARQDVEEPREHAI